MYLRTSVIVATACVSAILLTTSCGDTNITATSPNGKITFASADSGRYVISYDGEKALEISSLGFEGCNEISNFKLVGNVKDDYTMIAGKKSHCINEATEFTADLSANVQLILRMYNDGVALRYRIHNIADSIAIPREQTAYRIAEGTKRWIMRWNEAYEALYPLETTAKHDNKRWSYPALLQPAENVFVLLSESNIRANNSASSLWNDHELEIFEVRPDENNCKISGEYLTPWRVAIIGQLADVVESTLITDVAEPNTLPDTEWIKPGVVSWIYWAYNHGSNDYNIIKKYVDLAVALKLPYVLIDAEWDEMKDGKTIEDAVAYAKQNGIKPMIWYSSSVGWIDGAPGPKFRLNKPEDREKEFAWLEEIGVAGVKIDFFSGDNQMNMSYCIDLLRDAARHHLLMNFHGATLPRGWQRTYPNLLSTEAVYGAEWYNNTGKFTDKAARHNATLLFTRNVVGSMDYTPCAFSDSQHPHITTKAHELALTVLFESALQHIADRPESLLAQPQEVQDFFGQLPTTWDETRLVAGYPGEYTVVARRKADVWYVAGINGADTEFSAKLDLSFISNHNDIEAFADSDNETGWSIEHLTTLPETVKFQPRGGIVMVVK